MKHSLRSRSAGYLSERIFSFYSNYIFLTFRAKQKAKNNGMQLFNRIKTAIYNVHDSKLLINFLNKCISFILIHINLALLYHSQHFNNYATTCPICYSFIHVYFALLPF